MIQVKPWSMTPLSWLCMSLYTENKRLSIWQLCHHWWHHKLSQWQLMVPPVMSKLPNWRSFVCSVSHWGHVMHTRQWSGSSLVQVMACCLFGTKLLSEPIFIYYQYDTYRQTALKFQWNYKLSIQINSYENHSLQNGSQFVQPSMRQPSDVLIPL